VTEFLSFVLSVAGLGLMIFALGAQAGWSWAVKSLDVPPPRWVAAVLTVAGLAYVGAAVLRSNWLSALFALLLYGLLVGGALRIGPFRKRSGRGQPT
jgi:hypothetical protein